MEKKVTFPFLRLGSRGDIQPNIALGLEFVRRGHAVMAELQFLPYTDSHLFVMAARMSEPKTNILLCAAQISRDSFKELVSQYVAASN